MKTAYPQTQGTCQIRLYSNIPFDNTYKHHTIISDKFTYNTAQIYQKPTSTYRPCEQFIDRQDFSKPYYPYYYPRYDLTGEFNFNFTNGLIGSVTLELTPEQTNANYMRLKCGNDYYYYFITGISQDNADTYTLTVELDVLMTYQDEFLDGVKDVPIFTIRKHSHRFMGSLSPYCADLKTGDDAFAGVKPNIIVSKINLPYNNNLTSIKELKWLYICVDNQLKTFVNNKEEIFPSYNHLYRFKENILPLSMVVIPLLPTSIGTHNLSGGVTYRYYDNGTPITKNVSVDDLRQCIQWLINDGSIYGCKILPYPPFTLEDNSNLEFDDTNNKLIITASSGVLLETTLEGGATRRIYQLTFGNNKISFAYWNTLTTLSKLMNYGALCVDKQVDVEYELTPLRVSELGIDTQTIPSILNTRLIDPKLKFAPFRKYILNAQYSSEGWEFHPELVCSDNLLNTTTYYFRFKSVVSAYIGDNNFYTYIYSNQVSTFNNYKYEKIGLANNVNYTIPCGTNALEVFNSTQAQSFYQSKTASGITSGLTIAGGIASFGLGVLGAIPSAGASTSLIAGGATAIAGGVASLVNNFKSTSAKIEDLKNTPDSINISGSNYITDNAIAEDTNALPYVLIYECANVIKENADDYFYDFGYQVSRCCYFNTELKVTAPSTNYIDNNIFGRTIFNYVQTNEDITNKINANIPLIIKQKISNVLNQGVTLWSFFGSSLYNSTIPQSNKYLDNWFMKNALDNTEYYGSF